MPAQRVDGRTARWAGHRQQRRDAFVEAALALIDREGPTATVDQIGAELGVTRQAVYRQFADRGDLDHAIAERAGALLVDDLLPLLDGGTDLTGDLDGAVSRVLHAYLDFVQRHEHLYRFVRAHEAELAAGSAVRQVKDTLAGRVASLAHDVLVELALPAETAQTFAIGMVGLVDAVVGRWLDDPRALGAEELVAQLTVMVGGAAQAVTGRG